MDRRYFRYGSLPEADDVHGHNYLASASDLMVGLLFVFIIMVAFLAYQRNAEIEAHNAAIEAATHAIEQERDPRGVVTTAIGEGIRSTLANVRVDPASGVISLPEDVLFDRGSAQLKPEARTKLAQVAAHLHEILPCFIANQRVGSTCPKNNDDVEIETIFIEGHTDSVPMLREGGNVKLSLDRAISVENALVAQTALRDYQNKQQQPVFSYSAYADTRPLPGIDPEDARNRRVDLRIVLAYQPRNISLIGAALVR